jgi:hypothetical protein
MTARLFPVTCGSHHYDGVTPCTLPVGHDGPHRNGRHGWINIERVYEICGEVWPGVAS